MNTKPIALGARLKQFSGINTIGFKPDFRDYSPKERELILKAEKIYYPTAFYADLFNAMGKKTFPSFHTYKFALDKIKQTAAFKMLGIAHPETRVFYGRKQKQTISDYFDFPFIAKKPRNSARGDEIYLIENKAQLDKYLEKGWPAYIQEYLPVDRDMRIIIIGRKIRLAYFRAALPGNFRTNLAQGGRIVFDPVPEKACRLALLTASQCGWDDVGIDIIEHDGRFYVLEANMKYGTKGFEKAGINYKKMLADLIIQGRI